MFVLLFLLSGVTTLEAAPANQYDLHNYYPDYLTDNTVKFIRPKPTKKGPILFPNDGPLPPPTPLIVTSRPLSESIARSELNPNNSLAAQSQLNQVSYRPEYLARAKDYVPYTVSQAPVPSIYGVNPTQVAFTNTERVQGTQRDTFYIDYETARDGNARRSIFYGDDRKRTKLKVNHKSLYSRETSYNDMTDSALVSKVNRRMNRGRNIRKRRDRIYFRDGQPVTWKSIQNLENPKHKTENRKGYKHAKTIKRKPKPRHDDHTNRRKEGTDNTYGRIIKWRATQSLEDTKPKNEIKQDIKKGNTVKWKANQILEDKSINNDRKFRGQDINSSEHIKARSLRPLYEVTEHEHLRPLQNIQQKPAHHYKYQTNSPDPYYDTNDSGERHGKDYNKGDNYAFSYTVKDHKTGDDFSHSQQSTGSATNGEYRVRLPDGRMQIVSYTADENGYKADVRYDDHHNNDNSIDTSRENGYRPHPIHKPKLHNNFEDNFNDRDFSDNRDYIDRRYKIDSQYDLDETSLALRPTVNPHNAKKFQNNDFLEIKDDYNGKSHSLTDNNDDYLDRIKEKNIDDNNKFERAHDNYHYHNDDDASHELVDYSSDIEQEYQPHKSKFSSFNQDKPKTKVTPTYEELKDLFVTNVYRRLQNNRAAVSTPIPSYDATTERIVVIAPKTSKLYTNIHASSPVTPLPLVYSTPQPSFASTPRSYLVSTIANLKSQISLLKKPVLSNQYIDKINKYLSYK